MERKTKPIKRGSHMRIDKVFSDDENKKVKK